MPVSLARFIKRVDSGRQPELARIIDRCAGCGQTMPRREYAAMTVWDCSACGRARYLSRRESGERIR